MKKCGRIGKAITHRILVCSCSKDRAVALAVALSLVFFDFKIVGIGEGTILAMIGTGALIKLFVKLLKK